jgi:hypothetical protein
VQLAHTEAQCFALVQNVMEMQNQVAEMEIEVEVWQVLMVNSCIKVRLDSQAYKSPVVVKGPFFPRVVNPRYRIRRTNV